VNAGIVSNILEGNGGPATDIAVLNAGAALTVSGVAKDLNEGIARAQDSISSGAAMKKLNQWKKASHS
jgi:anthranilate phosphoribosyltransferase